MRIMVKCVILCGRWQNVRNRTDRTKSGPLGWDRIPWGNRLVYALLEQPSFVLRYKMTQNYVLNGFWTSKPFQKKFMGDFWVIAQGQIHGAGPKKYSFALKFMQIMIKMSTGMIKKQNRSVLLFKLCKNINHSQSYGCFSVYFWWKLLNFL